jgi:hypothetical protein
MSYLASGMILVRFWNTGAVTLELSMSKLQAQHDEGGGRDRCENGQKRG